MVNQNVNQNKMEERAKVFSENGQELFFDEQGNLINQNKMKQTAVEYLYSIMFEKKGRISKEEFNQAKEMEKEQIYNAYVHGQNNGYMYRDGQAPIINTDIYYNETFKSE